MSCKLESDMRLHEIARDDWPGFLDRFSRMHRGWLASVVVTNCHGEAAIICRESALVGVRPTGQWLAVTVLDDDEDEDACDHTVAQPGQMWFVEQDNGAHRGLRLESLDGSSLTVLFRSSPQPSRTRAL